jgi:hypothetical protein
MRAALAVARKSVTTVTSPDLASAHENDYRRRLLTDLRGYDPRTELFTGFPSDVCWHETELFARDLATVRYINYSYWNELSGGSRLAADAAANIHRGIEIFGVSNRPFLDAAQALGTGLRFPPMLLVGTTAADLVVLEGHLRLTAYALAPEHTPKRVTALIGLSPHMPSWGRY